MIHEKKIVAMLDKRSQLGLITEKIGQDFDLVTTKNDEQKYYITKIKPRYSKALKKGFAKDNFLEREEISSFAARIGAFIALNGSGGLSAGGSQGLQVKDGKVYQIRNKGQRFYETLAVYKNSRFGIIEGYKDVDPDLTGVKHTFHFGPWMIKDGVKRVDYPPIKDYDYIIARKHPRQGIGKRADGTIVIITVEGRRDDAPGLSIPEFADLFEQQGCVIAYNLDGGGSAQTWIDGRPLNIYADGKERAVGDFIYFTSNSVNKRPYQAPVFRSDCQ